MALRARKSGGKIASVTQEPHRSLSGMITIGSTVRVDFRRSQKARHQSEAYEAIDRAEGVVVKVRHDFGRRSYADVELNPGEGITERHWRLELRYLVLLEEVADGAGKLAPRTAGATGARDANRLTWVAFASNSVYCLDRGSTMEAPAQTIEDHIRRMTPVAAPPEQQAQVVALFKALEEMVNPPRKRAPRCQLLGPKGESIPFPQACSTCSSAS